MAFNALALTFDTLSLSPAITTDLYNSFNVFSVTLSAVFLIKIKNYLNHL